MYFFAGRHFHASTAAQFAPFAVQPLLLSTHCLYVLFLECSQLDLLFDLLLHDFLRLLRLGVADHLGIGELDLLILKEWAILILAEMVFAQVLVEAHHTTQGRFLQVYIYYMCVIRSS